MSAEKQYAPAEAVEALPGKWRVLGDDSDSADALSACGRPCSPPARGQQGDGVMSDAKHNGCLSAFPESVVYDPTREQMNAASAYLEIGGLSKRELFAAMALQGIMANPVRWEQIASDYKSGKKTYEQRSVANAVKAVSLADALLAELAKEQM